MSHASRTASGGSPRIDFDSDFDFDFHFDFDDGVDVDGAIFENTEAAAAAAEPRRKVMVHLRRPRQSER